MITFCFWLGLANVELSGRLVQMKGKWSLSVFSPEPPCRVVRLPGSGRPFSKITVSALFPHSWSRGVTTPLSLVSEGATVYLVCSLRPSHIFILSPSIKPPWTTTFYVWAICFLMDHNWYKDKLDKFSVLCFYLVQYIHIVVHTQVNQPNTWLCYHIPYSFNRLIYPSISLCISSIL